MVATAASKVMSLEQAVSTWVTPGMSLHLAFGGARPNALMRELARQFIDTSPGFTVSASGMGGSHLGLVLLTTGMVKKVISAFIGEAYPSPRPSKFVQAEEREGRLEIEEWSMLTLSLRLRAAAMGLDWIPTHSLVGTSFDDGIRTRTIDIDGKPITLIRALKPDLTLLHGVIADTDGNTVLAPPYGENATAGLAARLGCVVTAERIVSKEEFRRYAALPSLPGSVVRAVVEVPFGSHPGGIISPIVEEFADYGDDYPFMADATRATRLPAHERDVWLRSWFAVPHEQYLERLGRDRLEALTDAESSNPPAPTAGVETTASSEEHLLCYASRVISRWVLDDPPEHVIAGVGMSSLSTWLSASDEPEFPRLISEVGVIDYTPQPGNPFMFSFGNMLTTSVFSDLEGVLGMLVNRRMHKLFAVLSAGEVGEDGSINTSRATNGDWLTGSGGANDIAAGASEMLLTVVQRPGRLVQQVGNVTSRGDAVRWIVTDLAVLERKPGSDHFVVMAVRLLESETLDSAVDRVVASIPWSSLEVAADVEELRAPTSDELAFLRSYDPAGTFRGGR